ncbi:MULTISPECIES: MMPL family transporter [unclassified Corynebacterium]|uniref:MMPL family transporter n=1 Tax=unclassified Corynebacterium TaxID=2624378 RepID=UPI001FEFBDAD|nr:MULTISPECIES: MMPL family transporter [unclassified Corynebacterium]
MLLRIVERHPKSIVFLWLLIFLAGGLGALHLNDTVKAGGFNDQHGASFEGQKINQKAFGDPENELSVVVSSNEPIADQTIEQIETAAHALPKVANVRDSRQLPNLGSGTGNTQIIQVGINGDNTESQNLVPELRKAVTKAVEGKTIEVNVTGAPALDYDLNIQSQKDAFHAEMIAFPLLILVLLFIYRSVGPTLLTLVVAGVCLATTQGVGTILGRFMDVSNMYITGASLIGLAVSVDYCLFLISRYKENLLDGNSNKEALRAAIGTAGHTIRFGGLSVIAALCSLFIARNMVFSSIALAGITVTLIALLALSTLVPALLTLLNNNVFFGKLPGYHAEKTETTGNSTILKAVKKPMAVSMVIIIPLLAAVALLAGIKLQVPVASSSILPEGADSRKGIEAIEKELDPRELFPTSVTVVSQKGESLDGFRTKVNGIIHNLDNVEYSNGIISSNTVGDQSPYKLSASKDGISYARILITSTGLPDSDEAHRMIEGIVDKTAGVPGIYISGATAQGRDFDHLVLKSIPWIIISVLLVSIVLLGWAFKSWRLPIIAVALNSLVVSAAMGMLSGVWRIATGNSINSVTPIVIFAIVFGLSMDYMVLMASRMKEIFTHEATHIQAISEGVNKTSRLVISASVIMIGVFLSFMVAEISIVRELGLGLAIAVSLDALIVRPLLLPAILALLGTKVWGRSAKNFSVEALG